MPLSPIANNVTSFGFSIPILVSFALGARASGHLTIFTFGLPSFIGGKLVKVCNSPNRTSSPPIGSLERSVMSRFNSF
jgi:hypothetical protein